MTDLRQGVTPVQHAVLDQLDRRTPMWRMATTAELVARQDVLIDAANPDWVQLAALALFLAERAATAPGTRNTARRQVET